MDSSIKFPAAILRTFAKYYRDRALDRIQSARTIHYLGIYPGWVLDEYRVAVHISGYADIRANTNSGG